MKQCHPFAIYGTCFSLLVLDALNPATSFLGAKASAGKLVHMKVVDDKLRIIDDVPSSAVEMAVKDKVSFVPETFRCPTIEAWSHVSRDSLILFLHSALQRE